MQVATEVDAVLALLAGTMRWLLRHAMALLVIVLVLYFGALLRREWREFRNTSRSVPALQASAAGIQSLAEQRAADSEQRLDALRQASAATLQSHRATVLAQLAELLQTPRACPNVPLCLATGRPEDVAADYRRDVQLRLLEWERDGLNLLVARRQTLEDLRIRWANAYALLEAESAPAPPTCPQGPPTFRDKVFAQLSPQLSRRAQHLALCEQYSQARAAYQAQYARDQALGRITRPESARDVALRAMAPVHAELARLGADAGRSWISKLLQGLASYLPAALAILVGALLVPPAIKAFLYYVIAPIAARRPPIRLLPQSAAAVREGQLQSAVSQAVEVDAGHELLVHSDYLQSAAAAAGKRTKWLLDVRYPLASLASGMTVLTRIRPAGSESVVVSSTRDPFSEVGLLRLGEGEAMVLQPRCLVGVLQPRGRPVRITSHWRLASLTAWLTFQLRFLVFHGPGVLVVRGSRGVRAEHAGSPRLINQAATLGFHASLAYSTTRSETFVPYLLGRQGLFNDRFAGSPGIYVYEEMPRLGKRSGIAGRGIEGLVDALLKAFGI